MGVWTSLSTPGYHLARVFACVCQWELLQIWMLFPGDGGVLICGVHFTRRYRCRNSGCDERCCCGQPVSSGSLYHRLSARAENSSVPMLAALNLPHLHETSAPLAGSLPYFRDPPRAGGTGCRSRGEPPLRKSVPDCCLPAGLRRDVGGYTTNQTFRLRMILTRMTRSGLAVGRAVIVRCLWQWCWCWWQ